ncbi:MAG: IS630 transposase-related protein [Candidatus Zapsychrus exili]|nr:IS630 transposase-related protein [Candidatus Zapsychrus exili]
MTLFNKNKQKPVHSAICFLLVFLLIFSSIAPSLSFAQNVVNMPVSGAMLTQSSAHVPTLLRGMTVHPEDPFKFDFIIDNGHSSLKGEDLKKESKRLVNYFLASMTVPKGDLWVNLSPTERDRIVPDALGKTELGMDLLAQDYILKQLTASLMHPEGELGKKFWEKIYKQAKDKYGVSSIPTDTFNKVWILPESATIYENGATVYVVESKMKVMLEQDYLQEDRGLKIEDRKKQNNSSSIIKEIIIPAIEREVNEGEHFASLRQIYHSLILAKWYKQKVKNSILSQIYIDKNKVEGIKSSDVIARRQSENQADVAISHYEIASQNALAMTKPEDIYNQYMDAYKKGVYNYIKQEYDPVAKQIIPKKYFSGGFKDQALTVKRTDNAMTVKNSEVGAESTMEVRLEFSDNDKAMVTRASDIVLSRVQVSTGTIIESVASQDKLEEIVTALSESKSNAYTITKDEKNKIKFLRNAVPQGYSSLGINAPYADLIFFPKEKRGGAPVFVHKIAAKAMKNPDQIINVVDWGIGELEEELNMLQDFKDTMKKYYPDIKNVKYHGFGDIIFQGWINNGTTIDRLIFAEAFDFGEFFEKNSIDFLISTNGMDYITPAQNLFGYLFYIIHPLMKEDGKFFLTYDNYDVRSIDLSAEADEYGAYIRYDIEKISNERRSASKRMVLTTKKRHLKNIKGDHAMVATSKGATNNNALLSIVDEIELKSYIKANPYISKQNIDDHFGVSRDTLRRAFKLYGIEYAPKHRLETLVSEELLREYIETHEDALLRTIGNYFGYTIEAVGKSVVVYDIDFKDRTVADIDIDKLRVVILVNPKISLTKLAKQFKVGRETIKRAIERSGIDYKGVASDILDIDKLIRYIKRNPKKNIDEIAFYFGVSRATISRRIKKHSISYTIKSYDGERIVNQGKLKGFILKHPDFTQQQIADSFGVHKETIRDAISFYGVDYTPKVHGQYKVDLKKLSNYIKRYPEANLNKIAQHFGVVDSAISKSIRKHNIPYILKTREGERIIGKKELQEYIDANPKDIQQQIADHFETCVETIIDAIKYHNVAYTRKGGGRNYKIDSVSLKLYRKQHPKADLHRIAKYFGVSILTAYKALERIGSLEGISKAYRRNHLAIRDYYNDQEVLSKGEEKDVIDAVRGGDDNKLAVLVEQYIWLVKEEVSLIMYKRNFKTAFADIDTNDFDELVHDGFLELYDLIKLYSSNGHAAKGIGLETFLKSKLPDVLKKKRRESFGVIFKPISLSSPLYKDSDNGGETLAAAIVDHDALDAIIVPLEEMTLEYASSDKAMVTEKQVLGSRFQVSREQKLIVDDLFSSTGEDNSMMTTSMEPGKYYLDGAFTSLKKGQFAYSEQFGVLRVLEDSSDNVILVEQAFSHILGERTIYDTDGLHKIMLKRKGSFKVAIKILKGRTLWLISEIKEDMKDSDIIKLVFVESGNNKYLQLTKKVIEDSKKTDVDAPILDGESIDKAMVAEKQVSGSRFQVSGEQNFIADDLFGSMGKDNAMLAGDNTLNMPNFSDKQLINVKKRQGDIVYTLKFYQVAAERMREINNEKINNKSLSDDVEALKEWYLSNKDAIKNFSEEGTYEGREEMLKEFFVICNNIEEKFDLIYRKMEIIKVDNKNNYDQQRLVVFDLNGDLKKAINAHGVSDFYYSFMEGPGLAFPTFINMKDNLQESINGNYEGAIKEISVRTEERILDIIEFSERYNQLIDDIIDLSNDSIMEISFKKTGHSILHDCYKFFLVPLQKLTKEHGFEFTDKAMVSDIGGIDLNSIEFDVQGSGDDIIFDSKAFEPLLDMDIKGFVPVIINITPIDSVLPLLGLVDQSDDNNSDNSDDNLQLSLAIKKD